MSHRAASLARRCRWLPLVALAALAGCDDQPKLTSYPAESAIQNVVLIVQENKSFDSYFGRYCTAATGSNPSCTTGRGCCEAAPTMDPKGTSPSVLDDAMSSIFDPNHNQSCMIDEIHGGAMDRYTVGTPGCADPRNFALAQDVVAPYWALADQYALADRYFQPSAGASAQNNMYFAGARYKFEDNSFKPNFVGSECAILTPNAITYSDTTIGALLTAQGLPWRVYAEGLDATRAAQADGYCPDADPRCPAMAPLYPCTFDASDIPFAYYVTNNDDPAHFSDLDKFASDLRNGRLPAFSYIKFLGFRSEHSGQMNAVSDGVTAANELIQSILSSRYADRTLILLTWDESGGFFDHVSPPPTSTVDNVPYGARVGMLAIGRFARKGTISHQTLEHSSVVKFLEWNFLGGVTGQLGARDAQVHNLGSLLDPAETGVTVPD